jgi:hypothetical protein
MAVSIDATAKGANANSYVTLAEAETYMEGRLDNATWDGESNDNKNRALVMGTNVMGTNRLEQEEYEGVPTTSTQRLKWPRMGLLDDDGYSYDEDTVIRPIKEALYELALALINGELDLKDTGLEGFENVAVGPLNVTPRASRRAGHLPQQVIRLLRDLWIPHGGISVPVVRS